MKGLEDSTWLIAYIISNIVGLLFLWAAIKKPYLARLMFVLLFGWASVFNYILSHQRPGEYVDYAHASIKWYSDFINGWFGDHITEMVSLIAIGQGLIMIGMMLKGLWVRLACIGVIIFLLGIAPLGVYAAFPFSITVSVAAFMITRKKAFNYLWDFKKETTVYG